MVKYATWDCEQLVTSLGIPYLDLTTPGKVAGGGYQAIAVRAKGR